MKTSFAQLCTSVLISTALGACSLQENKTPAMTTGVNGVDDMHLNAAFWNGKNRDADKLVLDLKEIATLRRDTLLDDSYMVDLASYPETLAASEIEAAIKKISKPSSSDLFFRRGGKVSAADYERYSESLNLSGIKAQARIPFAMVLRRSNMRTWPSNDAVIRSPETYDLDRFQENALFPTDIVAVLHTSADGSWSFVQSYNYAAWVESKDIAMGSRQDILAYKNSADFLMVTGSRVKTNYSPERPALSELPLEMGTRIPLASLSATDTTINGQNAHASFTVTLPVRNDDGSLGFHRALIARSHDVHRGYLPFTQGNIVNQAFKFLGERYGWGHAYNGRDCTGFVSEIYKTFGILLPRNSGQQGKSAIGQSVHLGKNAAADEILSAVSNSQPGDLLHSPGHVMLYLGNDKGMPYVIHDLAGYGWLDETAVLRKGAFNGVSVTPLTLIHSTETSTYFEGIYAVRGIR